MYKDTYKTYKKHLDNTNTTCIQKFGINFQELISLINKSEEQKLFINNFYKYSPVIESNSSMNLLCKYIENLDFQISNKIRTDNNDEVYHLYKSDVEYLDSYKFIINGLKKFNEAAKEKIISNNLNMTQELNLELYHYLSKLCSNPYIVLNCLIDYFYIENPKSNKDILWMNYGELICKNIIKNSENNTVLFPFPHDDGDIEYLGYKYKLKVVDYERL